MRFERIDDGFVGHCGRAMCRICWQGHVIDSVQGSGDFARMAELIDDLANCLCQESELHNYCEAILDGSWPSAIEQLEHALLKARAFRLAEAAQQGKGI